MDNFAEQLVKKQITAGEKLRNMLILAAGCLVAAGFLIAAVLSLGSGIMTLLWIILAAAAGVGSGLYFRNTKVEYEYTYTNGELDVDKIIAQSKRKSLISIEVRSFTDFGRNDSTAPDTADGATTIFAADGSSENEYYADFTSEEYGASRLIFTPNEKMLENITRGLSPQLRRKLNN